MFREHDEAIAIQQGVTVEEVREARKSAYAKIRSEMRKRGHTDIPETDEGLFLWLQRFDIGVGKPSEE